MLDRAVKMICKSFIVAVYDSRPCQAYRPERRNLSFKLQMVLARFSRIKVNEKPAVKTCAIDIDLTRVM